MLEILFVIFLFGKLKKKALNKNRHKGLAWLIPAFWFGGEFSGAFFSAIIYALLGKPVENNLAIYGYALFGGLAGAGVAFLIVHFMPAIKLFCPECGKEYTNSNSWLTACMGCDAKLEVIKGEVVLKQNA